MAKVLVTGGAGYVGSHCCLALSRAGHTPIVFDNFHNGHRQFVKWGPLAEGDIRDAAALDTAFRTHRPEAVLHCAALAEVGPSLTDPARFYDVNVTGSLALLDAMRRHGVSVFVFSSSCATYGAPVRTPMDETHPQAPINPYGRTKLVVEHALREFEPAYGLRFALLRYFNAAGAAWEEGIGERHQPETHAIPLALHAALGRRGAFEVFGADYETPDGACIRDYVHVLDLADAHVRAIDRLLAGEPSLAANLGTGTGASVFAILEAIKRNTNHAVPTRIGDRRAGDPAVLVADNAFAQHALGWAPQQSLDGIVASAWRWHVEIEPRLFPAAQ
jgi:UDP-glucose 4-epimerase